VSDMHDPPTDHRSGPPFPPEVIQVISTADRLELLAYEWSHAQMNVLVCDRVWLTDPTAHGELVRALWAADWDPPETEMGWEPNRGIRFLAGERVAELRFTLSASNVEPVGPDGPCGIHSFAGGLDKLVRRLSRQAGVGWPWRWLRGRRRPY
jgi:hypothetical protein